MMEVPLVCPNCERRSVGYVSRESRLKIRHTGHYELTCKDCVEEHKRKQEEPLYNIIGAMTRRTKSCYPNLKLMNERQ